MVVFYPFFEKIFFCIHPHPHFFYTPIMQIFMLPPIATHSLLALYLLGNAPIAQTMPTIQGMVYRNHAILGRLPIAGVMPIWGGLCIFPMIPIQNPCQPYKVWHTGTMQESCQDSRASHSRDYAKHGEGLQ